MYWPRLVASIGLAAFSCAFPDYQFEDADAETCHNGMLDGTETKTDCGGSCDPCPCSGDDECPVQDQVCADGACQEPCEGDECGPTCSDTKFNGEETDVDCGQHCPTQCAIGKSCAVGADCVTGVCADKGEGDVCQPPACDDGVWNGSEAFEDCGADCPLQCANDRPCRVPEDCQSLTCDEVCVLPLCENHEHDDNEGDKDCGGPDPACRRCNVRESCQEHSDCVERVCTNGECAEPSCTDNVANGDETDRDCGGPTDCDRCGTGAECTEHSDCLNEICNDEGECQAPACDDGVTNGNESDEDCGGGGDCEACPLGDHCTADRDCDTEICDLALEKCVSCNDMKQNGSELGEDCGGDDCALCKPGEMCTDDDGCVNYLCDDGTCETGLALDYSCDQCGNQTVNDKISYIITLRNLSTKAINVNDVQIRYYLSAEVTDDLSFECAYQETSSCGQTRLRTSNFENSPTATHYVETMVGSMETIERNGSATVEVSVLLGGSTMNQENDYSFNKDKPQLNFQRITLHRAGSLIWGALPE